MNVNPHQGNPAAQAAAAAAAAAAQAAQQHQHQMALHQQHQQAMAAAAHHQHQQQHQHQHPQHPHQHHQQQHHQQMVNLMTGGGMPPSPTALMGGPVNMGGGAMMGPVPTLIATSGTSNNGSNSGGPSPNASGSLSKPNRKRRVEGHGNLTVEQKRRICEKHRSTPKITQKDLCRWAKLEFNLKKAPTQPTMSNILKNEHLFKDAIGGVLGAERKTIRPTKHAHFDQVLANWVMERQNKGTITGDMIKQRGRDLAKQMGLEGKLGFSNGWLASFKARHGLVKRAATVLTGDGRLGLEHGSVGGSLGNTSADGLMDSTLGSGGSGGGHVNVPTEPPFVPYPVSMDMTLDQIQDVLREYVPSDIYTVDETGLFFRASPSKLVQGDEAQALLHDEGKLSVLLATNADASDLMEPYIIGSLVAPRHIKNASTAQLGYHYVTSSRSRMTVFIFQQWLRDFNARMASAHRYVVLLMDNAPSHVLGCVHLTNVRVIMFAPHLGMKVQPMRGGILQAFKGKYRLKHLTLAIDHLEDGFSDIYKITQLQAMKWITEAWQQVSKEVIVNAWKPLGLQITFPFDPNNGTDGHDDKNVEEELWGLLYCLQLSGVVNTKMLVNNRWENDIHKRLNEDMIEDPKENDAEFQIPDPMVAALTVGNMGVHHTGGYGGNPHEHGHHMGMGGPGHDENETMGSIHSLSAKEQLKAFRDVIRFLERTGAGTVDPHLTSVIEYLKKKQLTLRFDNASSSTTLPI